MNRIVKEIKISTEGGQFLVSCPHTGNKRDAKDCEKCKRLVLIDPVKAVIKCKQEAL